MWERVETLLEEKGMTVADLSRLTGIGKSTFSGWKNGKYVPKSDKRRLVADALGVSILYIDGISDERTVQKDNGNGSATSTVKPLYDISCGEGSYNDMYATDFINVNEDEDGYAWCQVHGNSMYPVLLDGDYVKVRLQTETSPTDLTAIKVNGDEVTCKYVEVTENGVWLRAENTEVYKDRFYSVQEVLSLPVSIVGKVVELKRRF